MKSRTILKEYGCPFDTKCELYKKIEISSGKLVRVSLGPSQDTKPSSSQEINRAGSAFKPSTKNYLPGQPFIDLNNPNAFEDLSEELLTPRLNKLKPYLWLVATQNSSHISPITAQIVRGRQIVITEHPGLHLVWIEDRVFVKPIPKYLLSHAFWKHYITNPDDSKAPLSQNQREQLQKAAMGFIRTYKYLIQHRSDFRLARDEYGLIPKNVKHAEFVNFIKHFDVEDEKVSPRYHYGDLRLSRLNFWITIFLREWVYMKVHGQYAADFARFYAPLLFIFAVFSVILGAMQLALAAQQVNPLGEAWKTLVEVSRIFSVLTIICILVCLVTCILFLMTISLRELVFAIRHLLKAKKTKTSDQEGLPNTARVK